MEDYFRIEWMFSDASSGNVKVVNFHPRWKEAAQKLCKSEYIMNDLRDSAKILESELKIPFDLEFHEDVGLKRITLITRSSLDLILEKEMYESHNINGMIYITATTSFMQKYVNYLKDAITLCLE